MKYVGVHKKVFLKSGARSATFLFVAAAVLFGGLQFAGAQAPACYSCGAMNYPDTFGTCTELIPLNPGDAECDCFIPPPTGPASCGFLGGSLLNPGSGWLCEINNGCAPPLSQCSDGVDNDGDGFIDLADPGCLGPSDDDEANGGALPLPVPGCMDWLATNFNPLATVDDGSCTYPVLPLPVPGCMDWLATNFNPLATVDDGSCTYPPVSPVCGPIQTAVSNPLSCDVAWGAPAANHTCLPGETVQVLNPGQCTCNGSSQPIDCAALGGPQDLECSPGAYGPGNKPCATTNLSVQYQCCTAGLPQCSDGIDNDGDGFTDLADPGCSGPSDDDEINPALPPPISVTLTPVPASGPAVLIVDATANVGGSPVGPMTYQYDCTNDGAYDITVNSVSFSDTRQCAYPSQGAYIIRVRVTDLATGAVAGDTASVTALPPSNPATVTLEADCGAGWLTGPQSVVNNTTCTLRWMTGGIAPITCTANGAWSGTPVSGSGGTLSTGSLAGPAGYQYDITCTNPDTVVAAGSQVIIWAFAPLPPGPPSNPNPAHLSTNVSVLTDLSWTAGAGATNRDVYFGSCANPPLVASNIVATQWILPSLNYSTQYCWRVVEKNAGGSTSGPVWQFTTENPPVPTCSLSASSPVILKGNSVTLFWNCTSLDGIILSTYMDVNPPPDIGPVSQTNPPGGLVVAPQQTTTYTVTAQNVTGNGSASVTVDVYVPKIREVIPEL